MKWKNLTGRDVIRILKDDGWFQVGSRGSHRYFKHLVKKGKVTVAVHGKETIPPGTLRDIFRQAQLTLPED
jgi:predicted RNA binding protein YcfA (HicA-like mRNA interferase family)